MQRDSARTRERILGAVGTVLAREGFSGIGINAIAREAGVGKTLIYRYFGGLPELLRAFSGAGFWPTHRDLTGCAPDEWSALSPAQAATTALTGHLREIRARPLTREIMKWELLQRNELSDALARAREEAGIELLASMPKGLGDAHSSDPVAIGALLHAGISYLALRAETADAYLGITLNDEAGWQRIRNAITDTVDALLRPRAKRSRNIARSTRKRG